MARTRNQEKEGREMFYVIHTFGTIMKREKRGPFDARDAAQDCVNAWCEESKHCGEFRIVTTRELSWLTITE